MKKQIRYLVVTDVMGGIINAYIPARTLRGARATKKILDYPDKHYNALFIVKEVTIFEKVK